MVSQWHFLPIVANMCNCVGITLRALQEGATSSGLPVLLVKILRLLHLPWRQVVSSQSAASRSHGHQGAQFCRRGLGCYMSVKKLQQSSSLRMHPFCRMWKQMCNVSFVFQIHTSSTIQSESHQRLCLFI